LIRSIVSGALFAALALAIPMTAQAQQRAVERNTVTVTPLLSASFGTPGDLGSSLGIGAGVGYDWTENLGFEFEVARVFDVAGDDDVVDWSLTNYSGNVIYHFNVPRVTPYATFGIGWEHSSIDFDDPDLDADSSTEIAWNIGGGVKYALNDRLVARADLRRFQVNDEAPDHWRLYGGLTFWIKR
jgi:opacity protein-like surface antigen